MALGEGQNITLLGLSYGFDQDKIWTSRFKGVLGTSLFCLLIEEVSGANTRTLRFEQNNAVAQLQHMQNEIHHTT